MRTFLSHFQGIECVRLATGLFYFTHFVTTADWQCKYLLAPAGLQTCLLAGRHKLITNVCSANISQTQHHTLSQFPHTQIHEFTQFTNSLMLHAPYSMLQNKKLSLGLKIQSMMKRFYIINYVLLVIFFFCSHLLIHAQQKKIPLDHSVYESWKTLHNARISNDGQWVTYEINPQQGDGYLYLVNIKNNRIDSVPRGYNPVFSNQSEFLVFKIKPQYAVIRQAKKDKKKKDEMPKDSLGIWLTNGSKPVKFPDVKSFKVPEDGAGWFVFQHHKEKDTTKVDTALTDTTNDDISKVKARGSKLVIIHPLSNKTYNYDHVVSYEVSRQGKAFGFVQESSDTIPVSTVSFFDTDKEKLLSIFNAQGKIPRLALDEPGTQMAFLYHHDTSKIAGYDMYKWDASEEKTTKIIDTLSAGIPSGWGISKHGNLWFSGDGTKLFFGTAPKSEKEKEDTLLEEEKFHVDIWNWKDTLLQPMQKKRLDNEKKRTYLAVYHIKQGNVVQLADELVEETRTLHKGNGDVLLGFARKPYGKLMSWEASWYRDVWKIYFMVRNR